MKDIHGRQVVEVPHLTVSRARATRGGGSRPVRKRSTRAIGLCLIGLVWLAAGLMVAELVARWWPRSPAPFAYVDADPVLHHRLRPSYTAKRRGVEFRINALGLKDREYPPGKPPGVFRVLILGDSFTEGFGLPVEQTMPKQVEALLDGGRCSRSVEVVNAGVSSYSPILEYLFLVHVGLGLGPDLVVLSFDMTDSLTRGMDAFLLYGRSPTSRPSCSSRRGAEGFGQDLGEQAEEPAIRRGGRDTVRDGAHGRRRMRHGDAEARGLDHLEIIVVVANRHHPVERDAEVRGEMGERRPLRGPQGQELEVGLRRVDEPRIVPEQDLEIGAKHDQVRPMSDEEALHERTQSEEILGIGDHVSA